MSAACDSAATGGNRSVNELGPQRTSEENLNSQLNTGMRYGLYSIKQRNLAPSARQQRKARPDSLAACGSWESIKARGQ